MSIKCFDSVFSMFSCFSLDLFPFRCSVGEWLSAIDRQELWSLKSSGYRSIYLLDSVDKNIYKYQIIKLVQFCLIAVNQSNLKVSGEKVPVGNDL